MTSICYSYCSCAFWCLKCISQKNRQLLVLKTGNMCIATGMENMMRLMSFVWSVLSQKKWSVICHVHSFYPTKENIINGNKASATETRSLTEHYHHYDKNVIRTLLVLWVLIKMCLYEWWLFNLDSRWENRQGAVAGQGRLSLTQHGPCRQVHMLRQSAARTFTHTYCAHFTVEMKD